MENFALWEVDYELIRKGNPRLDESETEMLKRKKFSRVFQKHGLTAACVRTWGMKDILKNLLYTVKGIEILRKHRKGI